MRTLPRQPNKKQQLIIRATADFYGAKEPLEKTRQSLVKVALWLMGRRVRNELNKEEKEVADMVKTNLEDETYKKTFETEGSYTELSSLYGI